VVPQHHHLVSEDPATAATNFLLADTLFENSSISTPPKNTSTPPTVYGTHDRRPAAATRLWSRTPRRWRRRRRCEGDAAGPRNRQLAEIRADLSAAPGERPGLTRARPICTPRRISAAVNASQSLLARQPPVDQAKPAHCVDGDRESDSNGPVARRRLPITARRALMPPNDPGAGDRERLPPDLQAGRTEEQAATRRSVDEFLRVAKEAPT